ncbi:MAG: hypothetical protein ACRC0L_08495 [Angustibacter sp.]
MKSLVRTLAILASMLGLIIGASPSVQARSLYYQGKFLCSVAAWHPQGALVFVENYTCYSVHARIDRYYGSKIYYYYGRWSDLLSTAEAYNGTYAGGAARGMDGFLKISSFSPL